MKREPLQNYGINAYIASINRDDAEAMLALSSVENRGIRPTRVAYYEETMKRGEWLIGPPLITSGPDVIDGHHRLRGVPNSGAVVRFLVIDVPDGEVYRVVDDNVKRSVADVLSSNSHNRNRTAAAAKAMMAGMAGAVNTHYASGLTRKQQLDFIAEYEEVMLWLSANLTNGAKGLISGPVQGAFGRAYLHMDSVLLETAAKTLVTGLPPEDDPSRYSPIVLLRNWILTGKRTGRFKAEAYGKTERALVAIRDSAPVKVLKEATSELFPLPNEFVKQPD